jgi:hypothetical protein
LEFGFGVKVNGEKTFRVRMSREEIRVELGRGRGQEDSHHNRLG